MPALPFELACLPHRLLRFLRLPVVSYAVPALVAIGQAVSSTAGRGIRSSGSGGGWRVGRSLKALERCSRPAADFSKPCR